MTKHNSEETLAIFQKSAPVLSILLDENRQRILLMLCQTDQLTVSEITDRLSLSRPAVSHHLKLMRDAGILAVNQVGTERHYRTNMADALGLLKQLVTALEADVAGKK